MSGLTQILIFIGLGFYWAWLYYSLFSAELFHTATDTQATVQTTQMLSFVGYVLVMLISTLFWRAWIQKLSGFSGFLFPALASLGTALMVFGNTGSEIANMTMVIAGGVLTGLGTGFLLLMWGQLFISTQPEQAPLRIVSALVFSVLVFFSLRYLPIVAVSVLCSLLPLFSWLGCALAFRASLPPDADGRRLAEPEAAQPGTKTRCPLKLGLVLGAVGLVYGWIMGLNIHVHGIGNQSLVIVGVNSCLALVVLAYFLITRKNIGSSLAYSAVLPVLGTALVALGLSGIDDMLVFVLCRAGYSLLDILIWLQLPRAFIHTHSVRLFSFSRLCLDGCALLGMALSRCFISAQTESGFFRIELLIVAALLFAILTVTLTRRNIESSWDLLPTLKAVRRFGNACDAIAEEYRLTEREREIMVLVAHGRSASYIADKLFIKLNTVQTHTKNFYRKLKIHSRQELLSLIETNIDQQLALNK